MSDLNYVFLIGRLTSDPAYKIAQTRNSYCTFSIANNRKFKKQSGELVEETSFINCIAWGRLSEFIRNYLKKGMLVAIEGRLRQITRQIEEGKQQSSLNVVVNNIQILSPKGSFNNTTENISNDAYTAKEEVIENPILDDTEDDIPF